MELDGISIEEDPAGELAAMVVGTRYEDIPAKVVALAKQAILDTLAVTVAGSGWEAARRVAETVPDGGSGPLSPVLVFGRTTSPGEAAFANGLMARALDMGDVHDTGGHVTEWNVPILLAALPLAGRPVTGRELLEAYLVGAEVGVRIFAATGVIPHSDAGVPGEFQGTFCAIASLSRLLGLSREQTWNALGIGYSVHGMSEMQKHSEGSQTVQFQHAFVAETAVRAVLLARDGVTGPRGIFWGRPGGVFRHLGWDDFRPELLTDRLAERWVYGEGLMLKPYSSCKYTHSFVASVVELVRRHRIDPAEIVSIDGIGSPGITMVTEPAAVKWHPRSVSEALFSAPYVIATAAVKGDVFLGDITAEDLRDPLIADLMGKVSVTVDPSLPDRFDGYPVAITVSSGETYRHTTPYVKGHPRNPMTWEDVAEKFRKCVPHAAVPFSAERVAEVIDLCARLEAVPDVRVLVDALTPGA